MDALVLARYSRDLAQILFRFLLDAARRIFKTCAHSEAQMGTRIKRIRFALIGMLLLCVMAMQARAATIAVTTTNDSGPGSLRQALVIANDGDKITFAVTGTIGLTSGGLLIAKNVTISGPGSDQLSIDGNQALFVLGVFPDKTATISRLSITNGQFGIWNYQGTLTLNNCVVSLNSYGGIWNDHGGSTLSNCVVSGNSYVGILNDGSVGPQPPIEGRNAERGGDDHPFGIPFLTIADSVVRDNFGHGVSNISATLTILNSTLIGNSVAGDDGGGISSGGFKAPGSVTVISSTISGNSADSGGGIASSYWSLTVVNSTISGNSASYNAGGIANSAGALEITNSTISSNSASYDGGGIYSEGSVLYGAPLEIANSTISGNSAGSGGGIYNDQQSALEISNTILNAGASGENIFNNGGSVTSHGYNLSSDDGGGLLNGPGDQINTDPLLGPLQGNGGPTLTHAPLPGSPAIDAGDPNFTPPPLRDQRGPCFRRVFGHRIDIGSVETQPQPRCPTPRPRPTPPR
jgi:predicted outer membrane repeat protein